MFDSGVLGLAIGLILIYFLLSLLCSGINELVEAFLGRRAKFLEAGIVDLIGVDLKQRIYQHPIVKPLFPQQGRPTVDSEPTDKKNPSYLPASSFSEALVSIFTDASSRTTASVSATANSLPIASTLGFYPGLKVQIDGEKMLVSALGQDELSVERAEDGTEAADHAQASIVSRVRGGAPTAVNVLEDLEASIDSLPPGRIRDALAAFTTAGDVTLERWRVSVERWFDDKMDRVSGWYGRRTRWWLFMYAVVIVLALNADTTLFARTLWRDATLRDAVVSQAQVVTGSGSQSPCQDAACVADRLNDVKVLGLPLGWPDQHWSAWNTDAYAEDDRVPHNTADWWLKGLGLVLTAAALTLGAPFWFDLLNKVTNFRAAGPPPTRQEVPARQTAQLARTEGPSEEVQT